MPTLRILKGKEYNYMDEKAYESLYQCGLTERKNYILRQRKW